MNGIKQLTYAFCVFAFLVFFSWILIHLLTVFGVFLAIAYPVWWILVPKATICIFCRSRKEGERCPSCHQIVHKAEGFAPKTFLSAIFNGCILLAFSVLSIGIVFIESQFLFRVGLQPPIKSASFSLATQQEHQLGEIFPMQVKINSLKQPINAVRVDFSYDPTMLEVVNISTKDSFANVFIQKQIDNKAGIVRFAGGLPNPGFSGDQGIFTTIYFRGLKTGIARVSFLPSSVVLANNGRGDNLLGNFGNASYLIVDTMQNMKGKQSKADLQSYVLGDSTNSAQAQMIFYDEQQVLGSSTAIQKNSPNPSAQNKDTISKRVSNFDAFVLGMWGNYYK